MFQGFFKVGAWQVSVNGLQRVVVEGQPRKKIETETASEGNLEAPTALLHHCTTATRCHPHPGPLAAAAVIVERLRHQTQEGKQLTLTTCHFFEIRLLTHSRPLYYMQRRAGSF